MGEVAVNSKNNLDKYLNYILDSFKKGDLTLEEMKTMMSENKAKLLTIHASKGLESPKVLLWGNFPIKQKPYMRNSDERKVLYVGITRAIDECIILN